MSQVFTWKHTPGSQGKNTFNVFESKFGDGYKQTIKAGINNKVMTWPLTFEGDSAYIQPICDFFDEHAGAKSFLWTSPGSAQSLWLVKEYSKTSIGGGVYSVTADFEQNFVP